MRFRSIYLDAPLFLGVMAISWIAIAWSGARGRIRRSAR